MSDQSGLDVGTGKERWQCELGAPISGNGAHVVDSAGNVYAFVAC